MIQFANPWLKLKGKRGVESPKPRGRKQAEIYPVTSKALFLTGKKGWLPERYFPEAELVPGKATVPGP